MRRRSRSTRRPAATRCRTCRGRTTPHVIHDPVVGHAFKNSIILALGAATAIMLLTAVASWVVVRTRLRGRSIIDNLAFMPLVVPGLVLGVALLAVYLRIPSVPIYGSLWILFIAYLTRFMPYGMRYSSTSMFQIGRELEESAAMSGAGWFRRSAGSCCRCSSRASWPVDLHHDRLGPRDSAARCCCTRRARGAFDRDLGVLARRQPALRRRARDPDDRHARRTRRDRVQARRRIGVRDA